MPLRELVQMHYPKDGEGSFDIDRAVLEAFFESIFVKKRTVEQALKEAGSLNLDRYVKNRLAEVDPGYVPREYR